MRKSKSLKTSSSYVALTLNIFNGSWDWLRVPRMFLPSLKIDAGKKNDLRSHQLRFTNWVYEQNEMRCHEIERKCSSRGDMLLVDTSVDEFIESSKNPYKSRLRRRGRRRGSLRLLRIVERIWKIQVIVTIFTLPSNILITLGYSQLRLKYLVIFHWLNLDFKDFSISR